MRLRERNELHMKRTPIKRRAGKKQTTDRAELNAITDDIIARSGGVCEHCKNQTAVERHHIKRRSQGGTNTLDNIAHLCGDCHRWVHGNPTESAKLGLLHLMKGIG